MNNSKFSLNQEFPNAGYHGGSNHGLSTQALESSAGMYTRSTGKVMSNQPRVTSSNLMVKRGSSPANDSWSSKVDQWSMRESRNNQNARDWQGAVEEAENARRNLGNASAELYPSQPVSVASNDNNWPGPFGDKIGDKSGQGKDDMSRLNNTESGSEATTDAEARGTGFGERDDGKMNGKEEAPQSQQASAPAGAAADAQGYSPLYFNNGPIPKMDRGAGPAGAQEDMSPVAQPNPVPLGPTEPNSTGNEGVVAKASCPEQSQLEAEDLSDATDEERSDYSGSDCDVCEECFQCGIELTDENAGTCKTPYCDNLVCPKCIDKMLPHCDYCINEHLY